MLTELDVIKNQKWFYEFSLPDGTKTESYLSEEARQIHTTREKILREYLDSANNKTKTAFDISCHEGYFTLILSDYFERVIGVDKNANSLEKARQIAKFKNGSDIEFVNSPFELWNEPKSAEFVLCFGLLYHIENPIQILRKLANITIKTLCLETQVLPFNFSGFVEDGSYQWQRKLNGIFGLCADYSESPEGGLSNLALIPSKEGLDFLLREFGFQKVNFHQAETKDYEQFTRGHRVVIFAEK